ncbi:MAG: hypothetical protein HYX86_01590 [Chloroflexi bacterium]|nr:hypothetical protein [Chloroflexota bacterium]
MKIVVTWAIAAFAAILLLSCGGGGDGQPSPTTQETPPAAQQTPEATAQVEEEEPPDLSDVGFVDNLLAKEEAGEWTRGEGLVATLKLFAGELDAASVLRHPDLLDYEGTGILKMAYEYLEDGPDAQAKAEISRLLDLLVFSNEQLEAMAGLASAGVGRPGQLAPGAAPGPVEDCTEFFSGYGIPPGVGQCLEVAFSLFLEDLYPGENYRVFRPAPSLPQAGWTDVHVKLALEAMDETVPIYKQLGKLPPVNLVFSVAGAGFFAQAAPNIGKPCGVVLYTTMQSGTFPPPELQWKGPYELAFKQVIAHELAHCFQMETFPEQNKVDHEFMMWREEGLADYLSNVVYPKNNLEYRTLKKLADIELATTLFDRSYANFIWFQYLFNRSGNDGIFDLLRSLPSAGGRPEQEAALAAYPGMDEMYHDFARAMTDGTQIEDTGGGLIPYEISETNRLTFEIAAPYSIRAVVEGFGVLRLRLVVEAGKQGCLNWSGPGMVLDQRPTPGGDWSDLPSTLPKAAAEERDIVLVATATKSGEFTLKVDPVQDLVAAAGEELVCECIVGTWEVDSDDVRRIRETELGEAFDTVSVSGKVTATYQNDGTVTFEFDDWEWRETSELPGDFPDIDQVTRIEGTARGSYEAMGGQLALRLDVFETTVTVVSSGLGLTISLPPETARVYVAPTVATYQCSADRLAIPWEEGETVEWTRVR